MYGYVTVLIEGIAAGLFALTAALYLGVFKKNRLRVITGIILAVYAAYLVKDIVYLLPYVASNDYIYKVLLSVDNWAVPLYAVYAFEVISPHNYSQVSASDITVCRHDHPVCSMAV